MAVSENVFRFSGIDRDRLVDVLVGMIRARGGEVMPGINSDFFPSSSYNDDDEIKYVVFGSSYFASPSLGVVLPWDIERVLRRKAFEELAVEPCLDMAMALLPFAIGEDFGIRDLDRPFVVLFGQQHQGSRLGLKVYKRPDGSLLVTKWRFEGTTIASGSVFLFAHNLNFAPF